MANASLFVESGAKLDKDAEEVIRSKLVGKKLDVLLNASDVNDKQVVTNLKGAEKTIIKALKEQAPLLVHAKKFVFKPTVKSLGDYKLMVETDTQRAYACTLLLQVPEGPKAAAKDGHGALTIESLYDKADFSDFLNNRTCRVELAFTINHTDPAYVVKQASPALKEVQKQVTKEVDAAIMKTVAALKKGQQATGTEAMSWADAKKLTKDLDKEVARIIDSIAHQGDVALQKMLARSFPGTKAHCSVTARFDKFFIRGDIRFAGGGDTTSANEKSVKPLEGAVGKLDAVAGKLDASTDQLVKAATAYCTAVRKALATKAAQDPAELGRDKDLGKRLDALLQAIEQTSSLLEAEGKQTGTLTTLVNKIKKVHASEKKDAQAADEKKDHQKLAQLIEKFRKEVGEFETTLKDSGVLCKTLKNHTQAPLCFKPVGLKTIEAAADTLDQKRLQSITKRLLALSEDAIDLIED